MPYTTTWTPPELVLEYKGVSIYHVYKDDEIEQGSERYSYVCDIDHNCADDSMFDIRDFPDPDTGPKISDHPEFIGCETGVKYGFPDCKDWFKSPKHQELKEQWDQWHETGEPAAIENHLKSIIDAGHLDQWRAPPETKTYPVRIWATARVIAHTEVQAMDDDEAAQKVKAIDTTQLIFGVDNCCEIEGDEIAYIECPDVDRSNEWDDIEVDLRPDDKVLSWQACYLVEELAKLTDDTDKTLQDYIANAKALIKRPDADAAA